ncbi:hypothetical protein E4Z66_07150 [Aliishimia ponticola]|uniref:Outer membrane protein beta-barrel domain-containing protein n=1 Tax=Aliishimia ponticola TaxID=2499833 RepID=A0A4S4NEZ9_9RHOB|nr:hypothetical protein [Aliishimia ponticola]THH36718.1 hypothetical protein E4Z66_07150 [Aliishimia ponticola]
MDYATRRNRKLTKLLSSIAVVFVCATPVFADPTIGLGLNFTFGGGQVNPGVGLRVFSNDEEDEGAASLGIDYMFGSQSWRGSIGAAYLMDNTYVELNGGYDFGRGTFDFGLGGGWVDTDGGSSGSETPPATESGPT